MVTAAHFRGWRFTAVALTSAVLAIAACLLPYPLQASTVARYRLIDLSKLWPSYFESRPLSLFINDHGEVVGSSGNPERVFVYKHSHMRILPSIPGSSLNLAGGLNDHGWFKVYPGCCHYHLTDVVLKAKGMAFESFRLHGPADDLLPGYSSQAVAPNGAILGNASTNGSHVIPEVWKPLSNGRYTKPQLLRRQKRYCDYLPTVIWSIGGRVVLAGSRTQEMRTAESRGPRSSTSDIGPTSSTYGQCMQSTDPSHLGPWPVLWAPTPFVVHASPTGASIDALGGNRKVAFAAVDNGVCDEGQSCTSWLAKSAFAAPIRLRGNGTARLGTRVPLRLPRGYHHLRINGVSANSGDQPVAAGWVMHRRPGSCPTGAPRRAGTAAVVWVNARPILLDRLLPKGSAAKLCSASAINTKGQILGTGVIHGVPDSAYLLTPVGVQL